LAEAGRSVVLIEANRIGWGASGRNGGQVASGPRADMDDYVEAVGRDDARKVWEIAQAANRLVKDLVARHAIDCDLTPGYVEVAWKPSHAKHVMGWAEEAAKSWDYHETRALSREEVADLLGTTRYHGGCLDRGCAHLHPLRYALGLGRAAATAGARLFERTKAIEIAPGLVRTERATIRAEHVLLACNGYLDGLVPRVMRRSMPINNFIAATEPLTPERAERLNRERLCVSDSKFVLNYYRLTPDNRLLWGGGESYGQRFPRDLRALVRRTMLEVYPDLGDLAITHAWGGTLAITITRMPAFQRLDAQTWAISGWSGSGVHMATMGGAIAAEAIAGTTARWDVLSRLPTPAFPGGAWFRAPLLAAAMTWYGLRDRL
ncbi:MAG: FAD-binding oxidoreductase, partial [Pseudomonadota bacterium]